MKPLKLTAYFSGKEVDLKNNADLILKTMGKEKHLEIELRHIRNTWLDSSEFSALKTYLENIGLFLIIFTQLNEGQNRLLVSENRRGEGYL